MKTRLNIHALYSIVLLCFSTLLLCTNDMPTQTAGGSTSTEVSAVTGRLVLPDSTIASGVKIRLRPVNYISDSAQSQSYRQSHSIIDTYTNDSGSFAIYNVLPDSYCVEASLKDSLGSLQSFNIQTSSSKCTLGTDTLYSLSWITGDINILYADSTVGKVQVYGLERSVNVDTNNIFKVAIPRGVNRIHISGVYSDSPDRPMPGMGFMDVSVNVDPGEKRDLGSLNLSPKDIRPCLDGSCDSSVIKSIFDTLKLEYSLMSQCVSWRNGRIIAVSFRDIKINQLPSQIYLLTGVKKLDLGNTGISRIIPEICIMRNLNELFLDHNNFTDIPGNIDNLINLVSMNLSNNQLTNLPPSIIRLRPDCIIDLGYNRLCIFYDQNVKNWATIVDPDWQSSQTCN